MAIDEFKQFKIWLCWRYEVVKDRRTKVPYGADGRKIGVDRKYKNRWVTHDEALAGKERYGYDGIGCVIPEGYGGVDVDDMGKESPLPVEIREHFRTYEEHSPSGSGQHLLFRADMSRIPQKKGKIDPLYYCKNPHNDLEMYFGGLTSRFFTFTEDVISDLPIGDCTEAALWLLKNHMLKSKFKKPRKKKPDGYDPIEAARSGKNSAKFAALYDNGDTSAYNDDDNCADLALCNYLAYYIGDKPDEIDRHFRESKLYREKWEREDYRDNTIQKAIDGCEGRFHPAVMGVPPFIYFDGYRMKMRVKCPLMARHIRDNLRYLFVRDSAKGGVLRYVYEDCGKYTLYSDDMLKGVIKKYITDYDESVLEMSDVSETFQQLITDLVFTDSTALNADENIINFQNGILKLDTMELVPHSPDYISTIQIPCRWTGKPLPTPVYDRFIADFTSGRKGDERLLYQFKGVVISNVKGWRLKKALFLLGPGDTGKTQEKGLAERLLGKGNYIGIDLKELESRFGTSNIYMKRLAGSADMSFANVDEVKVFKKATGGDSLFAEFKGMNGFEFVYDGLLWFCMNRLPKFGGDNGEWVYNRIIVINCDNVIPPEKQDKQLLDKLYAEREGIVYNCVMALKDVISNGYVFDEPKNVTAARAEYRHENSTVASFWDECMEQRPDGKIKDGCTTGKVYDVYRAWCGDNNNGYAKTAKEFREEAAEHLGTAFADMTVRRGKGGTFYRDYTLSAEAKQQYARTYGYDGGEFLA